MCLTKKISLVNSQKENIKKQKKYTFLNFTVHYEKYSNIVR